MLFVLPFVAAYGGPNALFYQPNAVVYRTPHDDGLTYESIQFSSSDGTKLSGWFIPATTSPVGTVIHLHGNAQNMTAHYTFVSWLPKHRFNLFVFDYRGYGESEGKPDRHGVHQDSLAAITYLLQRPDVDANRVIVFGQSLGGANAIATIGTKRFPNIAGVVIDSAFSAYEEVADDHVGGGWLGSFFARALISNAYDPIDAVAEISPIPLLIIHGTADRIVPYRHGQRLYETAREPKQLWTITNGRHTSALGNDKQTIAPRLYKRFLEWVNAPEPEPPSTAASGEQSARQ